MSTSAGEPRPGQSEGDDAEVDVRLAAALREAVTRAAVADAVAMPQTVPTPLDQVLDLVVRIAARAVPAVAGTLFLVDPGRRLLTFEVVVGPAAAAVKDLTVPLGHGVAGLVAVSGQPLAIANAQRDPRHARDIAERTGFLPDTILAVPVTTADGTVLGVLELLDRQGAPSFSLDDMDLLGWFARLAGLALDLRRAHAVRAVLTGQTLAALVGLPDDVRRRLEPRLMAFAEQVAADPVAQRTLALADQVAAIGRGGDAEQRACAGVLAVFADYLATRPAPGAALDALR